MCGVTWASSLGCAASPRWTSNGPVVSYLCNPVSTHVFFVVGHGFCGLTTSNATCVTSTSTIWTITGTPPSSLFFCLIDIFIRASTYFPVPNRVKQVRGPRKTRRSEPYPTYDASDDEYKPVGFVTRRGRTGPYGRR